MNIHEATITVAIPGRPTFTSKVPYDAEGTAELSDDFIVREMLALTQEAISNDRNDT